MTRCISLFTALALLLASCSAHAADSCHTGAYALSDGSQFVVQPSDAENLRYRFVDGTSGRLYRVSENSYESGEGWAEREPVTLRVNFGGCDDGTVRMDRGSSPDLQGHKINLPKTPISFDSGSLRLYGELVMPAKEQPRAVVVLQYGSGRESAVVNNYVQYLLPLRDIAVFVLDKRGTGRSTGEYSIDITPLARDLAAAVDAVRSHSGLKDIPVGLMGESQGGWVAPLAATMTPVDFVVVSYGLAVSMLEEDRLEVAQSLRLSGYDAKVLAKGEQLHRAAAKVMMSRFSEGLDELERLKAAYKSEPWFEKIGGDFTSPLTLTTAEKMPEVQALFDFPYDLAYDPVPILEALDVPQLWILAGDDTEAPHEATLAVLRQLESQGAPIEVAVFPDAEHGMIAVEQGPEGRTLAGRTAEGYFELLFDWIGAQAHAGGKQSPLSSGSPTPVSTERTAENNNDLALARKLDEKAPEWLMESNVPSLAVAYIRNGNVQWTRVYGDQAQGVPATTQTLYNIASLAKPISAEVILRLVSAGHLSLDEPLSDYWIDPDIESDPRHTELTLRLALSHQTGFKNWRYQTEGVLRFDADPGTQFGYSGEGFEYALRFTERKLKRDWESLASEYVFAPTGMTNTSYTEQTWFADRIARPYAPSEGYLEPSIQKTPSAADDVYSTIGDYAAFLVSVMNRKGLSAEIAEQRESMHVANPGTTADCDEQHVAYCPERAGMGLGWEVLEFSDGKVLLHTGGDAGEQAIAFYFPARQDGAVMFANGSDGFQAMLPAVALLFEGTDLADFALSRR